MTRIDGVQARIKVKFPQNFFARKYQLSLTMVPLRGKQNPYPKNGLLMGSAIRPVARRLAGALEKSSVAFSARENNRGLIILLHPDTVAFLNQEVTERTSREELIESAAKSKKISFLETEDFILFFPTPFFIEQMQQKDPLQGRIPIEVIYRGALRALDIRYKIGGVLAAFSKPL